MAKKIFGVYLAKLDAPDSEAHTRLELPASPWELHDAMDKVQLQENEELYLEVDDYYDFEYLAPHLDGADISLNELNDLAGQLAALDEVQGIAFEGPLNIYMFPSPRTGGMYHPDSIVKLHEKILNDAGIEHLRFHDLRHSFATYALQSGADVKTLSCMLGHYSAGFTLNTYCHATRDMQADAARKIGGFMSAQTGIG